MRKKVLFGIVSACVLMLALALVVPALTANADGEARVWVEFRPGQRAAVERALQGSNAQFHYTFDDLNAFVVTLPERALNGIRRNPGVVSIEEDAKRYLDAQTIPYGIDLVQARKIWDANFDGAIDPGAPTGAGRTVCIIDSGLWTGHEDFQGVDIKGGYPSNWNQDRCGHGTHVAGTINAMNNALGVVGVNPGKVSLYIVRVFGDNCAWTYSSTLADAANRCSSAGANIISMSLGGGIPNNLEKRTFSNLYNAGILSIAASGNTGATEAHYPASYDSVVSVSALDENKQIGDFSTSHSTVELAAPGVHVLSTVPYLDENWVIVDGVKYTGGHIEEAKRGDISGALADGGLCDSTNAAWNGKVVLCERGSISFADKVKNVENSSGRAALIYNNVPGNFGGTMNGVATNLIALSLSQEDGQFLKTNKLGANGDVHSAIYYETSAYEYYDGTSMATPHVSGVAALLWSWKPSLTNVQIRNAMNNTAQDLGAAGRDIYYGYGLVQAYDAWVSLGGGTPTDTPPTVTITNPADGATVAGAVSVTATASDDKGVTQVEFFVNGASIGVDTTAPYQANWDTTAYADGSYAVKATATDTIGQTTSDTNNVTVQNSTPVDNPPTVTLTAPAEGATVSGTVNVTANASDDKGVTQVEFFVNGASIGVDTTAPYQASWNTTGYANGSYTVSATAKDTIGQTASDSNGVTVNNVVTMDMHIGDLDGSKTASGIRWNATVTITVHDANHNPLAGVTVTGNWSAGGSSSCTTDANGVCQVSKTSLPKRTSSVTFTVTGATKSGYTYISAANHDPDGDSNGTAITVTAP